MPHPLVAPARRQHGCAASSAAAADDAADHVMRLQPRPASVSAFAAALRSCSLYCWTPPLPFHAGRSVRHATRPEASTFAPPPARTFPSCTSHPLPLLDSRAVALFACKLQTVTCEGAQPAWQREAVTTRCTTVAQHHTLEYSSEGWFGSEGALPEGLTKGSRCKWGQTGGAQGCPSPPLPQAAWHGGRLGSSSRDRAPCI